MMKIRRLFATVAVAAVTLLTGCSQIDTGNVGVIATRGQYSSAELPPGGHLTGWSTVYEVSTKENRLGLDDMKPKTSDQITMADLDIDVYYSLNGEKAAETMVRLAGDVAKNSDGDLLPGVNYVTRVAREAVYTSAAKLKSSEAHTKRTELAADVLKTIQDELDVKFGKGWWTITNVNVRALTVDPALEKSIREAAAVEYQIRQKEGEKRLAQEEADRKRIEAQGDADAIKLRAAAVQAQGGAEYVQLEWIKKWSGNLPTVTGGSTPLIQIPNVGK